MTAVTAGGTNRLTSLQLPRQATRNPTVSALLESVTDPDILHTATLETHVLANQMIDAAARK